VSIIEGSFFPLGGVLFGLTGVWTLGTMISRQVFYHLSHSTSFLCVCVWGQYFWDSLLFAQAGLESWSWSLPPSRVVRFAGNELPAPGSLQHFFFFLILWLELRAFTLSNSTSPIFVKHFSR
jgi:hypothetical protein